MKIYTRTGDAGSTGLVGGSRIAKASLRIEAIGEVDETNAVLGLVAAHLVGNAVMDDLSQQVGWLQARLFDVGAELASPPGERIGHYLLSESASTQLENWIDAFESELSPLKNFILPGGTLAAAHLHQFRSVARRAERAVLALNSEISPIRSDVLIFLNRLSDWAFVAARVANHRAKISDIPWHAEAK